MDALKNVKKSKQKNHKGDTFKEVDQLVEDLEKCANTKAIHEFPPCRTASIKAIAVKNSNLIGPSTRFSTGKMLFAKLSLISFIYELSETFMFLSEKVSEQFMTCILLILFTCISY